MSKAPKKSAKSPRKPRAKKGEGPQPIGASIEKVADDIQAAARDPFHPDVQRGSNVDVVNGRWKKPTAAQLKTIRRDHKNAKTTAKTYSGNAADVINKAAENKNLDAWAFKKAVMFADLSDELLCRRLPVFLAYLEDLGVIERATAQADLLDEAQRQADEKRKAEGTEEGDMVDKVERQQAAQNEVAGDEAREAAMGLAPSRRPTMTIVPKDEAAPAPPDAA